MAINSTAVWRVRVGGNDANGAAYDPAMSGAGTDYSQQDAAELSLTDIACSSDTTVTSITGGFTSAMIGNAIRITGGGATSGYYMITAHTDTNTITVDRTPGSVSGGNGDVGGAAATPARILDDANATDDKITAGNTVYIRGAGSDTPGTDDYATTGSVTVVAGTGMTTPVRILSENGRARLSSDGRMWTTGAYTIIEGLYITATGATNGSSGIVNVGANSRVKNCDFNTASQSALRGLYMTQSTLAEDCELWSGSTTPSYVADSQLVYIDSYGAAVRRCRIHHGKAEGIHAAFYLAVIEDNLVYKCQGHQIFCGPSFVTVGVIRNNTVDGGGLSGIVVYETTLIPLTIVNNIVSNHTAGYGLNIPSGTTALNDSLKGEINWNCYYNNSDHVLNISLGANDQTGVDPQYTDAANGDYSIGTNLKAAGAPGTWRGQSTPIGYMDIGAVQRQEPAGGTGVGRGHIFG